MHAPAAAALLGGEAAYMCMHAYVYMYMLIDFYTYIYMYMPMYMHRHMYMYDQPLGPAQEGAGRT